MLHYGAVIIPDGGSPGEMPVVVYAHGGDGGVSIESTLALAGFVGEVGRQVLFVIPSFRAEPLTFDGETYLSEGPPSPWDRDVDDALALLEVVLATVPEADAARIGVLGFSRGATVGMLMAAREPRIDLVVEYFGATDFFSPFVREIVEEALDGMPRDLPGLDYLDATFIQPFGQGMLTLEAVRPELVRRSPVYFVDLLPQLQVHHGTEDATVDVSQAELLIQAMTAIGRTEPDFESFIYEGGGHSPLSLPESLTRTIEFLSRLLAT